MTDKQAKDDQRHKKKMEKQKENIDATIASAVKEQGVVILLTGDGKGKTSSAFGMVLRALGYGFRVGVVQFIKGEQLSGEELYLKNQLPEVDFYQMGTGFTWDTQDRSGDIAAAEKTWAVVEPMLKDERYHLVILDEITYMINYNYLDEAEILDTLLNRPENQHVVITGRAASKGLIEASDTVSEVGDIKHAFRANIRAQKGIDL